MYATAKKIVSRSHKRSEFGAPRARNAHNNSPHRAEQCPRASGTAAPRAHKTRFYLLPVKISEPGRRRTRVRHSQEKSESLTPTQRIRCAWQIAHFFPIIRSCVVWDILFPGGAFSQPPQPNCCCSRVHGAGVDVAKKPKKHEFARVGEYFRGGVQKINNENCKC